MKTVRDINVDNKVVIVRFDYNVPIENGVIVDDTRIIKSLETLYYLIKRAKKVIILSHMGRIKEKNDLKKYSLKPVCDYLSKKINMDIAFCNYENTSEIINNNKIIMMENTRLFDLDNKKESNNDEELSKYFASFGEVFINDAFGTAHRCNASNVGISKYLESANGFLIEKEVNILNKLINNPMKPYIVIMGGSKVSDKIGIIDKFIEKVDKILIGGGMAYTFLKSKGYNIGNSICEDDYIEYCKGLLEKYSDKIVLPLDNYIEDRSIKSVEKMNNNDRGLDIGPKTVSLFEEEILKSKTIFFNGPLGLFEEGYDYGTKSICNILNNNKEAFIVVGGGDTVTAVNIYSKTNNFIVSTGGGAALEYLEGKELVGVVNE